jgi:hypothetical protein
VLRDLIGWSLVGLNVISRGLVLRVTVSHQRACSINSASLKPM